MKPCLAGRWQLVVAKSMFGFMPPPKSRTDEIAHDEPHLVITTRQIDTNGDNTVVRVFRTNGTPATIDVLGRRHTYRVTWEGRELLVADEWEIQGNVRRTTDRWSLSEDGSTITIDRHRQQKGGVVRQRLVLERIPSD